ncbi:hypothetical protein BV372_23625 [Nostoc sp. T09]|uniref:hypothetical protein n=1 Tax=Nostoc sp. T09 TaxID=1932621 RepID=UPI000A379587|nr:hypothetical protein [Nostoc sp. T09]OUL29458.1 hypothetical protein BV372_23625 [Nostoc sp. T09]
MSQNPRIDSGNQSSKTPGLKPALGAALASLEVQLDQELARYRRTRNSARIANPPRVVSYIGSSPQAIAAAILEQSQAAEINPNIPPAVISDTPQMEPATNTTQFEDMDHLLLSPTPDIAQTPTSPQPRPANPASSIVPTGQAHQDDNLLEADETPTQPDDYLESSEALLRSVTDEQPQTKKPSSSNDGILSPLGIGSMLLLLVASLTLGYVAFNPKGLTQLSFGKLFNSKSPTSTDNTTGVVSNSQPQPEALLTPIPKYPNLAAKEFPEVKDPNDVVGLKPKAQANPVVLPNPIPAQPVAPPAKPPIELSSPQPVNPIAVVPSPKVEEPLAPSNSPLETNSPAIQTELNAQTKPSADGFYHVIIDNQDDRAFASARQVVPDAYLSPDNKLIYLGAFKTQKEVQKHLQLLQKNGIQARVQQP